MTIKPKSDELRRLLRESRGYFVTAAVFSLAINLLYLASPLYMLQVYDRVISSASEITLVMLTIALLLALLALAGLDAVRARVLTRASIRLDRLIAGRVITAIFDGASASGGARSQLLRDFDTFRQFITGAGIHAVFDLPWAPIYILVIFALHPLLGAFAFGSAVLLILMALLNEVLVGPPLTEANEAASRNYGFTEMSLRNWEVVQAMGMMGGLLRRWSRDRNRMLERQATASDLASTMQSSIRFLRLSMQSVILGLGAYLVIERLTTAGAMFAASILLGRALQPVEQIVGSWRNLVGARNAYHRVRDLLAASSPSDPNLELPRPEGLLTVENLSFAVPGNIEVDPARGFVPRRARGGPWGDRTLRGRQVHAGAPDCGGHVALSRCRAARWRRCVNLAEGKPRALCRLLATGRRIVRGHGGGQYQPLPARRGRRDHRCRADGRHAPMILRLPKGYDTQVGEGGAVLSGGYRQRIGLARAVYGKPSLVVLDEPSSNLDAEGDAALADCILQLKRRGTTVVIVSHRPTTVGVVDKVLVLKDGVAEMFGPRAEVMSRLTRPVPVRAVEGTAGRNSA